jgi:Cys-Gly metallodipeptidase DUG1
MNISADQSSRRELYDALDYGIADVEASAGGQIAISSDRTKVLMGRMREPSLSLHGIEGAFYAPGAKTVIPASVSGKFSIRLVPDQTPENITTLVEAYLKAEFAKLNSKNTFSVELLHGGKPWMDDPNHWNFQAAKRATESVYGQTPDFTREGGSIPVTLTFADSLKKSIVLLPMGRGDDGAQYVHSKRR